METRGNPLSIRSVVKLHGATTTDRASTQRIPHMEETGETHGDEADSGTIGQPIADDDNKKSPQVAVHVAQKTVKRVPIPGRKVAHGLRTTPELELKKRPLARKGRIRSWERSVERPKAVDATTQTTTQRTQTMEPDEGALAHETEAEVNTRRNLQPTTDEDGRVHASRIVHEGTASRKPQRMPACRPYARSAVMTPQRNITQIPQRYHGGSAPQ